MENYLKFVAIVSAKIEALENILITDQNRSLYNANVRSALDAQIDDLKSNLSADQLEYLLSYLESLDPK